MKNKMSESATKSAPSRRSQVLGRSAASGRFVLIPATSKGATISIREANSAVESVSLRKK